MTDRLDRAHALRAAIHGWLKAHPHAGMAAITAAFPDVPAVTVRKSVQRLAGLGSVAQHGASTATTYTALGDEIYPPETMRQKIRTGHGNLLHDYNRDRLAQAWEARSAVHAFVMANPLVRMDRIIAAFPGVKESTLRNHVRALCKRENLTMHGKSIAARYAAATSAIYDLDAVREKLRTGCQAVGAGNAERAAALTAQPSIGSGKHVNRPEAQRPLSGQGGQFERSGRLNGVSLLALAG